MEEIYAITIYATTIYASVTHFFQILMSAQRAETSVTITVVTLMVPLSAHAILDSHWLVMQRHAMVLHCSSHSVVLSTFAF